MQWLFAIKHCMGNYENADVKHHTSFFAKVRLYAIIMVVYCSKMPIYNIIIKFTNIFCITHKTNLVLK